MINIDILLQTKFIILKQYIMDALTLLERATIFFSHQNNGKKPEQLGYKEAVEFSYARMSNKVKGVIFAPNKEIANAFITNQKILWTIAKGAMYGGFIALVYLVISVWLNLKYGVSILSTLIPLLVVIFIILMVLPFIFKKLKKNQKMIEGKTFVYTE